MALDLEQLRGFLAAVSYKPGWQFRIVLGAYEGLQLVIDGQVEDSYNPGTPVELDIHVPLPPFGSAQEFYEWLLWRVQRIEAHEAMEWLHGPDDRPLFDPHRPHADRDEHVTVTA